MKMQEIFWIFDIQLLQKIRSFITEMWIFSFFLGMSKIKSKM